jgi:hypothetical protein
MLVSTTLSNIVITAAQSFLRGSLSHDTETTPARIADALAAIALVKSLSIRDAMDLFLEARAACSSALCKQLSGAAPEGRSEALLDDMRKLRTCLGQTVDTAFALFASSSELKVRCRYPSCVCMYICVCMPVSMGYVCMYV